MIIFLFFSVQCNNTGWFIRSLKSISFHQYFVLRIQAFSELSYINIDKGPRSMVLYFPFLNRSILFLALLSVFFPSLLIPSDFSCSVFKMYRILLYNFEQRSYEIYMYTYQSSDCFYFFTMIFCVNRNEWWMN